MKTKARFYLIFLLALPALPLGAKKPAKSEPGADLVDRKSQDESQRLDAIMAERDSLSAELSDLQNRIAPLDEHIRAGVTPLLECSADTLNIVLVKRDDYRAALSGFESVKPLMKYYNPYSDEDRLDSKARELQSRLELADKVAEIKSFLSTGNTTKDKSEANIAKLEKLMSDKGLTEADKIALEKLKTDLSRNYNWANLFKEAIVKLSEWCVLPDKKTATDAYNKIIKPIMVNKIDEVYPGRTMLPSEFVKLNKVLSELVGATLNYDKGNNASKVKTEGAFKAWIKQLNNSL